MAISDKTRKLLWGKSGVRCAYCRCSLVMDATAIDPESIVGDECHIYAQHEGGPRRNENYAKDEIDAYINLILLCKVHHKMVDDQPQTYTADYLRKLKAHHEKWVNSELLTRKHYTNPTIAVRVDNASDVVRIISQALAYDFHHDDCDTQEEVALVGTFLQDLQDYGDIGSDMTAIDKTQFVFTISQMMKDLDRAGFIIFVAKYNLQHQVADGNMDIPVVYLRVVRKINPNIQTIDP